MRQLVTDRDEGLGLFFSDTANNEQIREWVSTNRDRFDLNEAFSVEVTIIGDTIFLSGDEDNVQLHITQVEVLF